MSGLASVLVSKGVRVSGSDLSENRETEVLRDRGAEIHRGHSERNITSDLDSVIISSAIGADHEEVRAAQRQRIPVVPRLRAVADLLLQHRSIGVAGTHGKTTTTAMVATLLQRHGMNPSYLIGAHCPALGGNAHLDSGDWFVAEVDESDGLLVEVRPDVAVLTNIGRDHLQTYRGLDDIVDAFSTYLSQSDRQVLCIDDPHVHMLAHALPDAITVGVDVAADFEARDVVFDRWTTTFDLYVSSRLAVPHVKLPAPGKHNVQNALCALAAASIAGIPLSMATADLAAFRLPHRRFELMEENGVTVVDDYAHLPEEIDATLQAIRTGWPGRRIIAIFQPHRYSRTQALGDDFGVAFQRADQVLVTPIYSACERRIPGITSTRISDAIRRETDCSVRLMRGMDETVRHLEASIRPADFIISFGAGDVWKVTDRLARILEEGRFLHREIHS
jgi:UDP-N-acetylmuramate--alanine ligase